MESQTSSRSEVGTRVGTPPESMAGRTKDYSSGVSLFRRLAHARQGRAVHVLWPHDHRDALVRFRDPVVRLPVRAAPSRGGAEDLPARHAEGIGVGIARVGQLGLALE